jgi:hypothetical protein
MSVVISIDPGVMSGWAEYRGGVLTYLDTYSPREVILQLESAINDWSTPPNAVVIEDSRMISPVFGVKKNSKGGLPAINKIARNIGILDGICGIIQEVCENYKVMLIQVSAKDKGAKLGAESFQAVTGWVGRTNEHQRDAAMVGWRYRHVKPS